MRTAIATGIGLLHLVLALLVIAIVSGFGFPDGHLTELEAAYQEWAPFLAIPLMALGGNYIALALITRGADTRLWFRISLGVSLVVVIAAVCVVVHLRQQLDDGRGGLRATPSACKVAGWFSSELSSSA